MALRNFIKKFSNTADKVGNALGNVVGGAVTRVAERASQPAFSGTTGNPATQAVAASSAPVAQAPTNTATQNTSQTFMPASNTGAVQGPIALNPTSNANPTPTPVVGPSPAPKADPSVEPVNFNDVNGATEPDLPPEPQTSDMVDAQIGAVLAGGTPVTKEEKQVDAATEQILNLQAGLLGQEEFIQQQEAFKQKQEIAKQINEINGLIGQKQAQLGAFENAREQEGGLGTFQRSDINDARRQAAIEIQGLQAAASVAEGNFMIAEEQLQNAIDLKYKPIQEQIGYLQEVLSVRSGQADRAIARADKDRDARLTSLSRRFDALQQDEEEAKAVLMEAGKKNPTLAGQIAKAVSELDKGLVSPADVMEQFLPETFGRTPEEELQFSILENQLIGTQLSNRAKQVSIEQGLKDLNSAASGEPLKALSGDAAKVFSIAATIKPNIEEIKNKIDELGYAGFITASKVDPAVSNMVSNVADKVGRLRSGGAINAEEEERFTEFLIPPLRKVAVGSSEEAIKFLDKLIVESEIVRDGMDPTGQRTANIGGSTNTSNDLEVGVGTVITLQDGTSGRVLEDGTVEIIE